MTAPRSIRGWEPKEVRGAPVISLAIATYGQDAELACLLYSLKAQTYPHWEAVVVHDGPGLYATEAARTIADPRIKWVETPERRERYGHPWRDHGVGLCTGDIIGLTNGDNYYAPAWFEWAAHLFTVKGADLVYCDCLHSHQQWDHFKTAPSLGLIDLGCVLARADLARATPFSNHEFAGDGVWVEALARRATSVMKIDRPMFVHN